LSFRTASAKWEPPGWSAARWMSVMAFSRIALRCSADRRLEKLREAESLV
jgi:hypothetical protein